MHNDILVRPPHPPRATEETENFLALGVGVGVGARGGGGREPAGCDARTGHVGCFQR